MTDETPSAILHLAIERLVMGRLREIIDKSDDLAAKMIKLMEAEKAITLNRETMDWPDVEPFVKVSLDYVKALVAREQWLMPIEFGHVDGDATMTIRIKDADDLVFETAPVVIRDYLIEAHSFDDGALEYLTFQRAAIDRAFGEAIAKIEADGSGS